jgi:hypothetical protein
MRIGGPSAILGLTATTVSAIVGLVVAVADAQVVDVTFKPDASALPRDAFRLVRPIAAGVNPRLNAPGLDPGVRTEQRALVVSSLV